ncbi:DEDD exonuclease domain-containing protein [Propioniciclava soli]|uniref:DEDD exonuclease domain-containing protein n=1 Tax=Propioniciclava soli TaxID=2775081 RepID=UPI001E289F53|nr:DEDD exonuclease domain-containing protein [Propioniciclava soli]
MRSPALLQPSFDDLGHALATTVFVVVDLETTGSGPQASITEIGAVRVRGGEVTGEFQTLVNPAEAIPPLISVLTGITNAMVVGAPRVAEVLPSFWEFARGAVLVAHNAAFDMGFLKRAGAALDTPWSNPPVVDTVALARGVLMRDEVPNVKLATLAHHFRAPVEPNHRALTDARATVHVLHALLERVGNLGVATMEDLLEFTRGVSPERRAKRTWASDLPAAPGVYTFVADLPDRDGVVRRQVLYVGKSVNIRSRVRSYFTAAEKRPRMEEMVRVSTGVEATVCRTPLEAEVLELRLIAAHAPRYNRRSKFPERQHWLKLTREPYPRFSIVRKVADDGGTYLGPFGRRQGAEEAMFALHDAFALRQCTERLSERRPGTPCALGEMGRCVSPCDGSVSRAEYTELSDRVRVVLDADVRPVLSAQRDRLAHLIAAERFEEAGRVTERLGTFVRAATRTRRLASLSRCPQIVAACRAEGGWEIHVIRFGRLAAAAVARPGEVPQAVARDAVTAAERVERPVPGLPAATIEEAERVAAWLERPGVRLIEIEGEWSWPLHGAIALGDLPRHALAEASPTPAGNG